MDGVANVSGIAGRETCMMSSGSMAGLELVAQLRQRGATFWSENGQLRYRAARGIVSSQEIDELRRFKEQILTHLEPQGERALQPVDGGESRLVRLSPVQMLHWKFARLDRDPAIRQIAAAQRIVGSFDVATLNSCLEKVVRRHDALRTQIVERDGTLLQEIKTIADLDFQEIDLSRSGAAHDGPEVAKLIEECILRPIRVDTEPLFGAALIKLRETEFVLVLVLEHIVSDARSAELLVRDLSNLYDCAKGARVSSLPAVQRQYPDHVRWQAKQAASPAAAGHRLRAEQLLTHRRFEFPSDPARADAAATGWGSVPIIIDSDLRSRLVQWSQRARTSVVFAAFTAYVSLLLRWCEAAEGLVQYQMDGRTSPEIENTIGCFATRLVLKVQSAPNERFADQLARLTEEYCKAYDAFALSGISPDSSVEPVTCFNWVPVSPGSNAARRIDPQGPVYWSPVQFEHPMLKNEHPTLKNIVGSFDPRLLFYDYGDHVRGHIYFPRARFSNPAMEDLAAHFMIFVRSMLWNPSRPVSQIGMAPMVARQ
jgi:hypothetical protein